MTDSEAPILDDETTKEQYTPEWIAEGTDKLIFYETTQQSAMDHTRNSLNGDMQKMKGYYDTALAQWQQSKFYMIPPLTRPEERKAFYDEIERLCSKEPHPDEFSPLESVILTTLIEFGSHFTAPLFISRSHVAWLTIVFACCAALEGINVHELSAVPEEIVEPIRKEVGDRTQGFCIWCHLFVLTSLCLQIHGCDRVGRTASRWSPNGCSEACQT